MVVMVRTEAEHGSGIGGDAVDATVLRIVGASQVLVGSGHECSVVVFGVRGRIEGGGLNGTGPHGEGQKGSIQELFRKLLDHLFPSSSFLGFLLLLTDSRFLILGGGG